MAEVLVVRLSESADQQASWIAADTSGARISPPVLGPLSAAKVDAGDRQVIVLVPGADVLTTTIDLPLKSTAKIQQALPFALEEFVAEDVEELHFAAGTRRDNGQIPVVVVNRSRMNSWLEALEDAGLPASSMVAENHGLPRIPGTISLLLHDDQVLINDGGDVELVMQGVGPAEALSAIGAFDDGAEPTGDAEGADADSTDGETEDAGPTLPRHVLVYCEPGADEPYRHEFIALRHDFDSVDIKHLPDGVLPKLAVTAATGAGVNLLQGEFGTKSEYASYFRPWRLAAMLLVSLGVVGIAGKTLDYFRLSEREAQLREQFTAEYQEIRPGATDIRDPEAIISSLRGETGGSAGASTVFLESLEQLSLALQENSAADIQAISYRAGVFDIRISAPSVSVLDNVQRLIDEGGEFQAEIRSTDQEENKVNSRIQIKAVGS